MEIDPQQIDSNRKSVTILSVCGGGARLMIPIAILNKIEEITGKPVIETFDLFCGSSSGTMVITALNVPGPDQTPMYSANWLKDNYLSTISRLMKRKLSRVCMLPFQPYFESEVKREMVCEMVGDMKMKDFIKPTIMIATDLNKGEPFYVGKGASNVPHGGEYFARDIICASCAHPLIYQSVPIKKLGTDEWVNLVDGGMTIKDPVVIAISAARKLYPNAKIKVLNLGTGRKLHKGFGNKPVKWGILKWKQTLLWNQVMMNSSFHLMSDLVGEHGSYGEGSGFEHLSIDPICPKGFPSPFSTDNKSFKFIKEFGYQFANDHHKVLEDFFKGND